LSWIASIDGTIDESEAERLLEISESSKHGQDINQLIEIVESRDLDALQLACEIIKKYFRDGKSSLFLEMAIGMAIADGYLLPAENYIIRFIADLLDISPNKLNQIFFEITDREFPIPSDPSRVSYWQEEYESQEESDSDSKSSQGTSQSPHTNEELIKAYAILGLEIGATKEQIKSTFRRLAKIHHPDRFQTLGKEAVAAATVTFQRIQDAYEFLVRYA
jgi:DnaJ like chaperone protein